jgi:hypothetical protein
MYLHIFLFRWKAAATAEHRAEAEREIRAFAGVFPGLLNLAVGNNRAENHGGYEFGGRMGFTDVLAYREYSVHPLHLHLLDWLGPLIEAVELDLPTA